MKTNNLPRVAVGKKLPERDKTSVMASTKTQQQQPSAGVLGGINSPEQLQQLKSQLEEVKGALCPCYFRSIISNIFFQDIQLLISSLKQLKVVQSKLVQSKEAVEQLGESKEGTYC